MSCQDEVAGLVGGLVGWRERRTRGGERIANSQQNHMIRTNDGENWNSAWMESWRIVGYCLHMLPLTEDEKEKMDFLGNG